MFKVLPYTVFLLAFGALGAATPGFAAGPEIPDVSVRLLVAGPGENGGYRGAVVLDLPAGWHTYWKNPGDAGIPAIFDWSKSDNLKAVTLQWPTPERYDDGYGISVVYDGPLTIPVEITPADKARSVGVDGHVFYGLCKDICLPAEADIQAIAGPGQVAPAIAEQIQHAFAVLPRRNDDPELLRVLEVDPTGAGKADVVVELGEAAQDLFAAGASGWYVGVPEKLTDRPGRYRLAVETPGKGVSIGDADIEFTIVTAQQAFVTTRRLD